MRAEYVNSVYKATKDIFEIMLNMKPQRKDIKVADSNNCGWDVNVLLGVTGDLHGAVLFGFSKEIALGIIKTISGMDMDKIDDYASSALGEMGNIIGGNALSGLSQSHYICNIEPPEVIVGECDSLLTTIERSLSLSFTTPMGEFNICIFLTNSG